MFEIETKQRTKGAESLRKALNILNIVGDSPHGATLSDVIDSSGLTRPTTYRMVAALVEEGFLSQDEPHKSLNLGPRFLSLAQRVWSDGDLRSTASVQLRKLVEEVGGTALLMVRSANIMSCIELAQTETSDSRWHIGSAVQILDDVAGQALLAFAEWDDIDTTIGTLGSETFKDETAVRSLKSDLAVARSRFYAVADAEGKNSLHSVAAPVFDFAGRPIAAVALHVERDGEREGLIHDLGAIVVQAARRISSARGGYPFGIDVPERMAAATTDAGLIVNARCLIGDSPYVDPANGQISWIDILGPAIHRFDEKKRTHTVTNLSEVVGSMLRLSDGNILIAEQTQLRILDPSLSEIWRRKVNELPPGFRFNDGALDTKGRIWLGAMDMAISRGVGFLLRYDNLDAEPVLLPGFSLPNGIAFDRDCKTMFVVDSMERTLCVFAYDPEIGHAELTDRIELLHSEDGRPSGLALAPDGTLLTCHWDGAAVIQMSAAGEIIKRFGLPVPRPSGLTVDRDTGRVIVTTARVRLSERDLVRFPLAGSVYSIDIP